MIRTLLFALGVINSAVACTTPACVFANANLRFGSGSQSSVNNQGLFTQPFYYSYLTNAWYQLTFANYPLDTAIGTGTTSTHWSTSTIVDLYSVTPSNVITDYSEYVPTSTTATVTTGYGKITSYRTFIINNQNIEIKNVFALGQTSNFVKTITTVKNVDTTNIQNVNIWIGTRDDFVGNTDVNIKTRGNIVSGNFTAISSASAESRAIMITNPTEGILFYSETPGVKTAYAMCCQFSNAYNTNPSTLAPATPSATDGSYAIVLPIGLLTPNQESSVTWYYAAGEISSLNTVVESVSVAQVADSSPDPTPTVTPTNTGTLTSTASETATNTETPTNSETSTNTETPTNSETATNTETSSETSTNTGTETSTASPTTSVSQSVSPSLTSSPSESVPANQTMFIQPFPSFYTSTPLPSTSKPPSKDNYATTGIVLGTIAGAGTLSLAILQLARNIRKPSTNENNNDRKRRQSIDSSSTETSSTFTEETESTRRPSITSKSPESDSGASEASKEVIEIIGSSPAIRRKDDNDNTFSLIKVNKDELNEVMNILRQRNKFASIYK